MTKITPETPAEQGRGDLALELLDDAPFCRLDAQTKESHRRIRVAVKASGTTLTDVYGVGPILAAEIIGYAGDVERFANRDASPPTTAPPRSNGPQVAVSCTGSRGAGTDGQ